MASELLYVTFSGAAINQVYAYDGAGAFQGAVFPASPDFDELRGMALDAQGRLYLASAYKKNSNVFAFGPPQGGVTRSLLGTLIDGSQPALLHPYGLAISGATLYVSSQDTNVVAAWTIGGTNTKPVATPVPVASYLQQHFSGTFFPGTLAASAVAVSNGGISPPPVPADQGGLWMVTTPSRHSVRGVVAANGSVFASDEAASRVVVYDAASGTPSTTITRIPNDLVTSAILGPVGVAVSPSGTIAIGSTGHDIIFTYDPSSATLRVLYDAGANGITQLSGLAYKASGSLLFGSRKNRCVYGLHHASGDVKPFTATLGDEPECLLVVPSS